mgnify:CR=1 FL=1
MLFRSLEAYCSPTYHPLSQGIALEGMRLAYTYLPRAYEHPGDIEARGHMMSAAAMGAVAFQKGLGAIHALAPPVGAHFGTHHGTTNAVIMPAVLHFNRSVIEPKIDALSGYLGIDGNFDRFVESLVALTQRLAIPASLSEIGASMNDLDQLVSDAVSDPSAATNPRPLTREAAAELYATCA